MLRGAWDIMSLKTGRRICVRVFWITFLVGALSATIVSYGLNSQRSYRFLSENLWSGIEIGEGRVRFVVWHGNRRFLETILREVSWKALCNEYFHGDLDMFLRRSDAPLDMWIMGASIPGFFPFGLFALGLVSRFAPRYLRRRSRLRRGACLVCAYDLTFNPSGICPECGTPVTPG